MSDFDLRMITGNEPPLMTDDDKDAEIERLRARLAEAERLLDQATNTCSPWCAEQIEAFLRPADSATGKQS